MMQEIKQSSGAALEVMGNNFAEWLTSKIPNNEYIGWLAIHANGEVAAGAGIWIMDWPPYLLPSDTMGAGRAFMYNVYTEEEHRGRGLARKVVTTALDWCRSNDVSMLSLHTSPMGKSLYESLGFETTNEMRLVLR